MAFSSTRLFWPSRYRFPIFSVSGAGGNAEQQMRRTRLDPGLATRAAAEGDVLRAATCTNIVYKTGGVVKIGSGLLALWMLLTGCTGSGVWCKTRAVCGGGQQCTVARPVPPAAPINTRSVACMCVPPTTPAHRSMHMCHSSFVSTESDTSNTTPMRAAGALLFGAQRPERSIVVYGADGQRWKAVMEALQKGLVADGEVTLVLERPLAQRAQQQRLQQAQQQQRAAE